MVAVRSSPAALPAAAALSLRAASTPALERPGRRDSLPEHTHYADTGCSLHPSCLSCPLARCRYDEPGGARRLLSEERDRAIVALRRRGRPVAAIAARVD